MIETMIYIFMVEIFFLGSWSSTYAEHVVFGDGRQ